MSVRAAKAGAERAHDGLHRPGTECPWTERQCSGCLAEVSVHVGWALTGQPQPWGDSLLHDPERCFVCRQADQQG